MHASGAEHRLNRQFGERFGDKAYSFEELIAELGAAFLCAELAVTNIPRPDHAQYIAHWLEVLKGDKKAIFSAASQASRAVEYLAKLQPAAISELAPERHDPKQDTGASGTTPEGPA